MSETYGERAARLTSGTLTLGDIQIVAEYPNPFRRAFQRVFFGFKWTRNPPTSTTLNTR